MTEIVYKFGDFELDCARYELRRNGRVLKLERLPMELLILLAEKNGTVVSRQAIVERLWGKDIFLDSEHGTNTAIRKIRTALHESAERPRFVLTVLGKGYRLVLDQGNRNESPAETLPKPTETASPETAPSTPARQSRTLRSAIAAAGLLLVVSAALVGFNVGGIRDRRSTAAGSEIRSIAVLPLVNLSGDPSQDYFAEGMTDELIAMLAKNTSLQVISRTSVMRYKGSRKSLPEIARELGADSIVEGSITRSANRLHLTAQLIQAKSDTHLWADTFDRDVNEAFSLPSELSHTIAQKLKVTALPAGPPHYVNPEAHDAYLHGRYLWFSKGQGREYFERAIQLQPDYAAAWSGLSDSYGVQAAAGIVSPREVREKAEAAARKAVELDDSLPEAHNSLAATYYIFGWNWKRADSESLRALELNPNYAEARHIHAYILAIMNHPDEALQEQRRSTELDPFARPWAMGVVLTLLRQFDGAINDLRIRADAQPGDADLRFLLAEAYRLKGMAKESAHELEAAYMADGDLRSAVAVRDAFKRGGEKSVGTWQLNELKKLASKRYISPWFLAQAYARVEDREQTLAFLEKGYQERSAKMPFLQNAPWLDFLHTEARYRAIVQKMGLPPAY